MLLNQYPCIRTTVPVVSLRLHTGTVVVLQFLFYTINKFPSTFQELKVRPATKGVGGQKPPLAAVLPPEVF